MKERQSLRIAASGVRLTHLVVVLAVVAAGVLSLFAQSASAAPLHLTEPHVEAARVGAHDEAHSAERRARAPDSKNPGSGEAFTLAAEAESFAPSAIRFSQSSVNGAADIADSMRASGWVGDPIDVVRMQDGGLTSVDNTRVLAANEAGINVQAVVHGFDDPLPPE